MPIDIQGLAGKIKSQPHWRVNFRPINYKIRIDEVPKAAFELVQKTQVRLRGWPYPFISNDRLEQIREKNYIASGSSYIGHSEYWRLYYSGQFINLFTVREKTEQHWDKELRKQANQVILRLGSNKDTPIPGFISIINLLYHLTEIFEFACRLYDKCLYDTDLKITLELWNIKGFALIAEFPRVWHGYYPATTSPIGRSWIIQKEHILSKSSDLALDEFCYLVSRFGWDNPPIDILKQDQQKFLSGRV